MNSVSRRANIFRNMEVMGDKILPTSEYDTFLILSDKIRQEATDLEALFYRDCHPPILRVSLSYTEIPLVVYGGYHCRIQRHPPLRRCPGSDFCWLEKIRKEKI